ncbi:MAG: flagellar hook-length control protein FliK, partial [Methylococcaceae bacterium]|nr:flagellar hook-length control protein FliK [Methylococcaceae bacterium]
DNLKPTVANPVQLTPELAAKAPQGTTDNLKPTVANPVQLTPELAAKAQQGTTDQLIKPTAANPVQLTPELAAKAPQGTTENIKPTAANPVQLTPELAAKAPPQVTIEIPKQSAFTQNPSESTARENALLSETTKQPGVLNPPKPQTLAQNLSPDAGSKRSDLTPTTDRVNLQESVNTGAAKASTPLMDDLKKFNNPYATQQVGNNLSLKQKTKDLPINVTSKNNSEIISTSAFIENRTKLRDVAINTAIASASLFKSNDIKPASPKVTDDAIALQVTTSAEHGEEKIKESELRRPGDLTRFNLITARNQQHLQSQMSERVTQMLRAGQWSADMKLNPENLGLIKVNMVMDKEQLKIMFTTQHHNVKELVESSMPRLRESLAESGINLADTSVGRDSQQQRQPGDPDSGDQFDFQTKTAENNSEELTEEKQRSTHDGELDTFV